MQGNILILEDDEIFARVIKGRLKVLSPQFNIVTFKTLRETKDYISTNKTNFELVFLDHNLPDGFGLDFLHEGWFQDMAVLVISSNNAPEMAGDSLKAGAAYFINKNKLSSELFFPLVKGLLERNKLQQELARNKIRQASLNAVKDLVNKLRHEVNNPLGAVLGAAYLLRGYNVSSTDYLEAAKLVELSSMRIKKVMDALCETVAAEEFSEAQESCEADTPNLNLQVELTASRPDTSTQGTTAPKAPQVNKEPATT